MLVELRGKGGRVCDHARRGEIRCPLIVRPTSEDQITGEMFQVLRAIDSRQWLSQLLNTALGAQRFRQQVFRRLRVDLWVNQPRYPRRLLPWDEGSTQVDVVITWENPPPTTVFCEMKYLADLSPATSGGSKQMAYPSDQLIRNIRVGLWRAGWFEENRLFDECPRDFILVVIGPKKGHPLVEHYRDPERLRKAIPHNDQLRGLPRQPFIGELSYTDIIRVVTKGRRWLTKPERILADDLIAYLDYKRCCVKTRPEQPHQLEIP